METFVAELLILLALAIIIFGPARLASVGRRLRDLVRGARRTGQPREEPGRREIQR